MKLALERLASQRLVGAKPATPEATVAWLLAVQAQEFAGALWGVGQRAQCSEADAIAALDDGRILRTHVLRPTWHLVAPADARWLLALTAPRVHAKLAGVNKKLGIAPKKHLAAIAKAVQGGAVTRAELAKIIGGTGVMLANCLIYAELEQVIISGADRSYVAFDARVPAGSKTRDDSLAELARRYFASHGPARVQDLAWWSGLTLADCRRAVELAALADRDGYYGGGTAARAGSLLLLPNFDEYLIAYRSRPRIANATNLVVADGLAVGGWRRDPFSTDLPDRPGLASAIRRYRAFVA